jgi:hypothetical protein
MFGGEMYDQTVSGVAQESGAGRHGFEDARYTLLT